MTEVIGVVRWILTSRLLCRGPHHPEGSRIQWTGDAIIKRRENKCLPSNFDELDVPLPSTTIFVNQSFIVGKMLQLNIEKGPRLLSAASTISMLSIPLAAARGNALPFQRQGHRPSGTNSSPTYTFRN